MPSLLRQRAGDDEHRNVGRAVQLERARAFVDRRAGGHHVVDQHEPLAAEILAAVEGAANVLDALAPRKLRLSQRVPYPLATPGVDR